MTPVLDSTYTTNEPTIYCVDGLHGTLKELADYFNVDPIAVSDLMLDGMEIQDALCTAPLREKYVKVVPIKSKVVEKKPVENVEKKPVENVEKNVEKKPRKKKTVEKETPVKEEKIVLTEKEQAYIDNDKKVLSEVVNNNMISTKATSDVQIFDDVVIITTTTTTVYRRTGK